MTDTPPLQSRQGDSPLLITVVGPTAIGKTELAIRIAEDLGAEILSSDSRQFYREIPIGTAQPTPEERARAPHHFVDFLSIHDEYSSGRFESDAQRWLTQHFDSRTAQGLPPLAVMSGGSGLYVQAVHHGLDAMPSDPATRDILNAIHAASGLAPLLDELQKLDPQHFDVVDRQNPHRVIRALEVSRVAGMPYSELRKQRASALTLHDGGWARHQRRSWDTLTLGLGGPRDWLHDRIERRAKAMIDAGWLAEAEQVLPHRELNALKTVGYPQLFDVLEGRMDLDTALRKITEATRQFARRQFTWFHRQPDVHWVDARRLDRGVELVRQFVRHGRV